MIADELLICASDNLVETYLRLGLAAPSSGVWEDEGFRACLGGFSHPICNFALRLRLDPWSARRLQELARSRRSFHVYVLPEDQPSYLEEILIRADFRPTYHMVSMVGEGGIGDEIEIMRAESDAARDRVSEFMARQFFMKQGAEFRDQVRWATFAAKDLDLYYLLDRGRPLAAVMLSRSPGALGIYNLCVASGRRRRGIGSSLLRWCQTVAYEERRQPVLQCDPSLEQWYASFGFRPAGRIKVFSLLQPDRIDIMDTGSVP